MYLFLIILQGIWMEIYFYDDDDDDEDESDRN